MRLNAFSIAALTLVTLAACKGEGGQQTAAAAQAPKPHTAFDAQAAMGYVRDQLAFGPRNPGSAGHDRAAQWLVTEMRKRSDTVIVQDWTHTTKDGKKLALRNVLARFRPAATERVLYLTHWDTRPVSEMEADPANRDKPIMGANDGASGPAMFLALADQLKKTPPNVGVDLLFVDGEDYGDFNTYSDTATSPDVLIGSTYFANHLPSAGYKPLFGVLWDMIADAHLQLYEEVNSAQFAPEVVQRVWNQAADFGYSQWFIPQAKLPMTDDHIPLQNKGLRVIDVLDYDYCVNGGEDCNDPGTTYHHTQGDTIDKLSAQSFQIVGDVALALVTGK